MSSRITGGILHVPASRPSPSRRIEFGNDDESGGDDAENGMMLAEVFKEKKKKRSNNDSERSMRTIWSSYGVGFGDQKAMR